MTIRKVITILALAGVVFSLLSFVPNNLIRPTPVAFAESSNCVPVGGALMTNIGAIAVPAPGPQSVDRGAERVAGLGGRWRARACSLVGWAIERSLVGVEEIAPAR